MEKNLQKSLNPWLFFIGGLIVSLIFVMTIPLKTNLPEPENPIHDFVYAANYSDDMYGTVYDYRLRVNNGKLAVIVSYNEKEAAKHPDFRPEPPKIYVFHHANLTAEEIKINYDVSNIKEWFYENPETGVKKGSITDPNLDNLNTRKILYQSVSSDGYKFGYYGTYGFRDPLFGAKEKECPSPGYGIKKDNRLICPEKAYYFLGWLED